MMRLLELALAGGLVFSLGVWWERRANRAALRSLRRKGFIDFRDGGGS